MAHDIHRPCEHCKQRTIEDESENVHTCSVCQRRYHVGCVYLTPQRKRRCTGLGDTLQTCYICEECSDNAYEKDTARRSATRTYGVARGSRTHRNGLGRGRTTCATTIANTTAAQGSSPSAENNSRQSQTRPAAASPTAHEDNEGTTGNSGRPDPDQTRQETPNNAIHAALPQDRVYDITIGQVCRKKLKIHPVPSNPHTDIHPTGQFEVYNRPVPQYMRNGEYANGDIVDTELACIYQPDGRCTYMLPPEQVAILYHRYQYMQQQHPGKMQKLKAGTFAAELHKLASRQHEGTIGSLKNERYAVEAKNQRCMPRPLRSILQEIIGCTKERFSSPLTVLPGTEDYWTVHEQDQVFGAGCDAYRTCWTGASTACPDFTEQAANNLKAVLWALQSAVQAQAPTLTLLLLPTYSKDAKTTSHMRWIKQHPEYCKQLVTLPTSAVPLELPANTHTHQRHPLSGTHS